MTDLANAADLIKVIELRLQDLSAPCAKGEASTKLKLAADRAGKVVNIEVLAGDRTLGNCLRRSLLGLATGAKAAAPGAVVELRIQVFNLGPA